MCKLNKKNDGRRIDPCMKKIVEFANNSQYAETLACCCGHGKYPMTIVIKYDFKYDDGIWEVLSNTKIPRKKKFYKKDKQGYYYIPEVVNEKKKN